MNTRVKVGSLYFKVSVDEYTSKGRIYQKFLYFFLLIDGKRDSLNILFLGEI